MSSKHRQSGVTLTEMTIVVAIIALLVTLGMPAIRAFRDSFESGGTVRGLISASLASARAIAAKEHSYAGIRFQQDLAGKQYMVFIIHDFGSTGFASGFRAVEGIKPIKLPDSVGVMDEVLGTTTFSIVFSPAGKLVLHDVQTIFNGQLSAMFQGDSQRELSRNSFIIYDRSLFDKLGPDKRFDYLTTLEVVHINPYTGTIISVD